MGPTPGEGSSVDAESHPKDQDISKRLAHAEAELERLAVQSDGHEWFAATVAYLQAELESALAQLQDARAALAGVEGRRVVRYTDRARRAVAPLLASGIAGHRQGAGPHADGAEIGPLPSPSARSYDDNRYDNWVQVYDTLNDDDRRSLRARIAGLGHKPLVSIILPVFNTPEPYLREAIESVQNQLYERWELLVVDDCSTTAAIRDVIAEYAAKDERIKVELRTVNGHISAASNTALALASGEWVACFDHDDVMAEHALAVAVLALADHPDAGLLYSDEDHLDHHGNRTSPYFKPDFDPILLLGQNYFAHLCMLRRDLVEQVGGYRLGYEGSQDWDLVLRVSELLEPRQVVHVPHVLYHWRAHPGSTASSLSAKPYAARAACMAVADHLARTGERGKPVLIGGTGFNRVVWTLPDPAPAVSIVVLPRDGYRFVRCIDSIRLRSTYPDIEIVVVDDGFDHPPLREYLEGRWGDFTVVRLDGDHSDAALRNAGARAARGDVLCFVDDDVEVLTDRWLEEMVGLLLQPGIGAVGAKLLYSDNTVQHAGVVMGIGKTVGHVHRNADRLQPGYFGRAILSQSFSAVSGACMVVRRTVFERVGGFDEDHFGSYFGDADLCLRIGEAGWRVGWTPFAELVHREAKEDARLTGDGAVRAARDIRYLHARWGEVLRADPAYNPNLSLAHETLPLSWPPRATWRTATDAKVRETDQPALPTS